MIPLPGEEGGVETYDKLTTTPILYCSGFLGGGNGGRENDE